MFLDENSLVRPERLGEMIPCKAKARLGGKMESHRGTLKPGFNVIVTVGDLLRHIRDVSPISRRHTETITVTIIWKQGFKTHLNSFDASPYCPRLIGDVGDIPPKMFPFNATVPDVSLSLPRRLTIIWKPGFTLILAVLSLTQSQCTN